MAADGDRVIEDIPHGECLSLLETEQLGRLAVASGEDLLIFPVNYAVDSGSIVIRTDEGTKLTSAPLARVAFEVDRVDRVEKRGWSVLVRGTGLDITGAVDPESERLRSLPLDTWAPGPKAHWIKIEPYLTTGRRLFSKRHLAGPKSSQRPSGGGRGPRRAQHGGRPPSA